MEVTAHAVDPRRRVEPAVGGAARGRASSPSALGFGEADAHRVGLVATELATNLVKHAQGGRAAAAGDSSGDGRARSRSARARSRARAWPDCRRCVRGRLLDGRDARHRPRRGPPAVRRVRHLLGAGPRHRGPGATRGPSAGRPAARARSTLRGVSVAEAGRGGLRRCLGASTSTRRRAAARWSPTASVTACMPREAASAAHRGRLRCARPGRAARTLLEVVHDGAPPHARRRGRRSPTSTLRPRAGHVRRRRQHRAGDCRQRHGPSGRLARRHARARRAARSASITLSVAAGRAAGDALRRPAHALVARPLSRPARAPSRAHRRPCSIATSAAARDDVTVVVAREAA